MRGFGGGRPLYRASIERAGSLTLDINRLRRKGVIRPDYCIGTTWAWSGGRYAKIQMKVTANRHGGELELHGEAENMAGELFELQQQFITLTTTPAGFNGQRFWFICPLSGRRVGKLYLPYGASRFAGRLAYGLVYESSRLDRDNRLNGRARKLRTKLGGVASNVADYPEKPKRMRWRTYDAAIERVADWEGTADALDMAKLQRLIQRLGA